VAEFDGEDEVDHRYGHSGARQRVRPEVAGPMTGSARTRNP